MRTFVSVDASSVTISDLQREIMSEGWSSHNIKPTEAYNLHFTLIFLGDVSDEDAGRIKSKLAEIRFEPFPLTYAGIGAFPRPSAARLVWIGVDQNGEQNLKTLASDVVAKMAELKFEIDKPFSPHMTLFRVRDAPIDIREIVTRFQGTIFGSDVVDRIHLKQSILSPNGPTYSNIYTVEAKK